MRRWALWAAMCGGLLASAPGALAADDAEVVVRMFQFRPGETAVAPGGRVVWTNHDEIKHTVTGERFNLALPGKGTSVSQQFNEPGVYRYFCERHQSMRGEIRVGR
jgi:plastocyanin